MNLRLINIKQLGGVHPPDTIALRGKALDHFPFIENAYLTLRDGKIEDFGPMTQCPQDETPTQDLTGRCILPAFVDSHSHLVYAGTREQEFNLERENKNSTSDSKAPAMRRLLQRVVGF